MIYVFDKIYSSKLVDHGVHLKDSKHAHYLYDGNAIGFALDSMGGGWHIQVRQGPVRPPIRSRRTGEETKIGLRDHEDGTQRPQRWDSETTKMGLRDHEDCAQEGIR